MIYLLHTEPDDNDTVLVTCPALPEVTTFAELGKNLEADIQKYGLGAIEESIAGRINYGEDIPPPATEAQARRHRGPWVRLPLLTALKVELYNALRDSDVKTRAELARRLNWHREQVDRLFRLDHKSQIGQIEEAFKALHRDIEIDIRAMA